MKTVFALLILLPSISLAASPLGDSEDLKLYFSLLDWEKTDTVVVELLVNPVRCHSAADGEITATVNAGMAAIFNWSHDSSLSLNTASGLLAGYYSLTVTLDTCVQHFDSIYVAQPAPLIISEVGITAVRCRGEANGKIEFDVAGGTLPYQFLWNNGDTTNNLENLPLGQYQLTITDENMCIKTADFTINEPELLTLSATITPIPCYGDSNGSISLSSTGGNGGYTYEWSNFPMSQAAEMTDIPAGNYTVLVQDSLACADTLFLALSEPPPLALALDITPSGCAGVNIGAIKPLPTGGTAPYSLLWEDGSTAFCRENLPIGNYPVTLTDDNGCQLMKTANVSSNVSIDISVLSQAKVSCKGGMDGRIQLVASGGNSPYTYFWPDLGISGSTVNGLSAGLYFVLVTDAEGCVAQSDFIVAEPDSLVASTITTDIQCYAAASGRITVTVAGGTYPYSYQWSPDVSQDSLALGLIAGSYSLSITDANACLLSLTNTLVHEHDLIQVIQREDSPASCSYSYDATAELVTIIGGNAPYSIHWDNGEEAALATALNGGLHLVSISDQVGCTVVDSLHIKAPLAANASFDIKLPTCPEAADGQACMETAFWGTPPYSFDFGQGAVDSFPCLENLSVGNYPYTIKDANNCVFQRSFEVEAPNIVQMELGTDLTISLGDSVALHAAPTWLGGSLYALDWTPPDYLDCATCPRVWAKPIETIRYIAEAKTLEGCIATDSITIFVDKERSVFFPSAFTPNADGINDQFIVFAGPDVAYIKSLQVFGRWGGLLYQVENLQPNDQSFAWNGAYKGKPLGTGVFLYHALVVFKDGAVEPYAGTITIIR